MSKDTKAIFINKCRSEIMIQDAYRPTGATRVYDGDVRYTLRPDEHRFIDPSQFRERSKYMFAQVEVRVCGGHDNQFIPFSPLELEYCDGIVINADEDGNLTHKFVELGRTYSHGWIKSWIPVLGVKERIQHILSAPSSQPAAMPS